MRKATIRLILMAAISGVAVPSAYVMAQIMPPAVKPAAGADRQSVPVKEVVLYTSGVGYFEHFGSVKGDGFTELHFKTSQVNDILKSLLLEDLDGGKVASVTYGSQEPLSHTLKSFEVDLSTAPSMSELLSQLRGASVTVIDKGEKVSGTVLSVEKKHKPSGEKNVIEVSVLNLLLGGGAIKPVELDLVTEVRLDDAKLQQELIKALSAVAAARDQDSKPVAIRFTGAGERRVRIGYVVEAPVWKASYRLVLTENAKNEGPPGKVGEEKNARTKPADGDDAEGGKLQGWAIVENQTDSDWENVQLSLVSGRPISFVEDLYQPLFVSRPVVEPELYASLRPQRYTEGLQQQLQQEKQAAAGEGGARGRELRRKAGPGFAAGKPMANGMDRANFYDKAGAVGRDAEEAIDAMSSVNALASGSAVGEFFQYTVGDVSLPRQKSAMIPIITGNVKAARLSIYNASALADHPLLGARLTNTTGKLLPQGPITVLDGGAYAGDASINDVPINQDRLLSYGIDQSVLIHNNDQTENSSLVTAKIVKGVLEMTYKQVFIQHYAAQNKGKADRALLIEHPRRQGWTLVQPAHALESTDTLYRFEESLPGNSSKDLLVKEEITSGQGIQILPMDTMQIEQYFRTAEIPDSVKKSLQEAARLKYALIDIDRQIQERRQTIGEITQEQTRIRENMKAVSASSDYYKRLEKELDAQETQIQKLKSEAKDLGEKRTVQQKALEDYLENLSVG